MSSPAPHADRETSTTIGDGFTLAAVGDCIVSRPLEQLAARDSPFADVVVIMRDADASFGNLETTILDIRRTRAHPHGTPHDWTLLSEPGVARDLRSLGLDLLGRANNHATDWGAGGLRETARWLEDAGLVHAGAGETLAAARAPRYLETRQGRVALVSITTSPATEVASAVDPFGEVPGRPGVNTLRVRPRVSVPPEVMRSLAALGKVFPEADTAWTPPRDPGGEPIRELDLFRARFVLGEALEVGYDMDQEDARANLRSIRRGKQHADLAVVAIHAHQGQDTPDRPPEFLRELARGAIDHGADIVVVSGPHRVGPIELHAGRPIFYCLGNFFWSDIQEPLQRYFYESSRPLLSEEFEDPASATDADLMGLLNAKSFDDEAVFRAVLAVTRFDSGNPAEIRLHPVELGFREPLTRSGIPRTASPQAATTILERVREISEPFHTKIEIEGGLGIIRPG